MSRKGVVEARALWEKQMFARNLLWTLEEEMVAEGLDGRAVLKVKRQRQAIELSLRILADRYIPVKVEGAA